jgi:hypothetical protein
VIFEIEQTIVPATAIGDGGEHAAESPVGTIGRTMIGSSQPSRGGPPATSGFVSPGKAAKRS